MIGPEIRCCQASTLATLLRSRADTQIDYAVEVIQPANNVIAATAQNFFLESSTSAFVGGCLSSRWLGWSPSLHVHVPVKRNTQSGLTSIDLVRAQHPTEPAKPLEKLYSSRASLFLRCASKSPVDRCSDTELQAGGSKANCKQWGDRSAVPVERSC